MNCSCMNMQLLADSNIKGFEVLFDPLHHGELSDVVLAHGTVGAFVRRGHCEKRNGE